MRRDNNDKFVKFTPRESIQKPFNTTKHQIWIQENIEALKFAQIHERMQNLTNSITEYRQSEGHQQLSEDQQFSKHQLENTLQELNMFELAILSSPHLFLRDPFLFFSLTQTEYFLIRFDKKYPYPLFLLLNMN